MTTPSVPLLDLLRKAGVDDTDFLREAVEWFLQQLMEAEVTQPIGAGPHERTEIRTNNRNGYRPRTWDTRVGTIRLVTPKLRQGTYYPETSASKTANVAPTIHAKQWKQSTISRLMNSQNVDGGYSLLTDQHLLSLYDTYYNLLLLTSLRKHRPLHDQAKRLRNRNLSCSEQGHALF